jgi:hypothetical protein
MNKPLIASFVALGLMAGPALAANTAKAPATTAKAKHAHAKKQNAKEDTSKAK